MDIVRKQQPKTKRRVIIGIGVAAVLIVGTLALRSLEPAAPKIDRNTVWVDSVQRGPFEINVRGPGTLVPEQIRWITAVTSGRVEQRLLEPGMEVTPETVILELTNPDVQLESLEAQRQLASVFRDRLQAASSNDQSVWNLSVRGDSKSNLRLKFDQARSGIHVTGSESLTNQFAKLVKKLGEPPRDGYRTEVFRLKRENHSSLHGAVKSIGNDKPKQLGAANPVDQSSYVVPSGALGGVQQTAFQNRY